LTVELCERLFCSPEESMDDKVHRLMNGGSGFGFLFPVLGLLVMVCSLQQHVIAAASSKTYEYFPVGVSYAGAIDLCAQHNGTLAIINSTEDNNAAYELMTTATAWFGLNDQAQEGVFRWVDGSPLTFQAWAGGEPNNDGEEDCVAFFTTTPYSWVDVSCEDAYSVICEFITSSPTTSPTTSRPSSTPSKRPSLSPTPPTTLRPTTSPTVATGSPSLSPTKQNGARGSHDASFVLSVLLLAATGLLVHI
jgi:hypothetical protein